VLERGVGDGEVAFYGVRLEDGDAAEGPGDQRTRSGRGGKRIDMVVDETLERVEAFRPRRAQKGDAGGGG
jgi:hypothetical protein